MPTNCEGTWMVGGTPVSAAYFQGEQVYPCGDEWFDYDPTYTKYIVKDEFIGTECLLPVSSIGGKGISVSVDANGERVWRTDTGTYPTITLEDKEVWVEGIGNGTTAHKFRAGDTCEWIEDIVALCKSSIDTRFAMDLQVENLSVAQAPVTNWGTTGTIKKTYWREVFMNAPNFTGKFHPSWFDVGYVLSSLNATDYPHDLSDREIYATSVGTTFMAKTTNLDFIPHYHSYSSAGAEAAPLGAYTKAGEWIKTTSTPGDGYYFASSTYFRINLDDPNISAFDGLEVGDTIHIVGFGGQQKTFFRFTHRADTDTLGVFWFENGNGTLPYNGRRTAFYHYKRAFDVSYEQTTPDKVLFTLTSNTSQTLDITASLRNPFILEGNGTTQIELYDASPGTYRVRFEGRYQGEDGILAHIWEEDVVVNG